MKISIIIVNYNVEYFLEQCLNSVFKATKNIDAEIFVVDNNSIDGSVEMVKEKFPQAILFDNKENLGFSKANNQAMRVSNGEYVLLLNPDTVVEEDTFEKVINFMDQHQDAGGLGVKMIDGKGEFLPESKRGLPTPAVAFYKIFGLSSLFPKSKKFGQYHLGYLDKEETHTIDVLSGAFMLMRKTALDKVGLLDEDFFMYGEDIDLSYRIQKGGFKNYYFPDTRIIHYKGESTKKSSVNYVFVFYNAMIIFAKKHFSQKNAKTFSFLINLAIYLRASMAIAARFIKKSVLPLIDFGSITSLLYIIANIYQKQKTDVELDYDLLKIAFPVYSGIWISSVWLCGGYDKPVKLLKILKGVGIGTAVILMGYALLDKSLQFSRLIIVLGGITTLITYLFIRILLHFLKFKNHNLSGNNNKRFVIVGKEEEAKRVSNLLKQTSIQIDYEGLVHPDKNNHPTEYLGNLSQLKQVVHIHKIDEIIFCAKDTSSLEIINQMSEINNKNLDFKIAQPESLYLIGSNSIDTSGDLYVLDINSITKAKNIRNKRILDFISSLCFLCFLPISIWFVRKKIRFISNCFKVFIGKNTWVGYALTEETNFKLPKIKNGIISCIDKMDKNALSEETINKINLIYAKDYSPTTDINSIFNSFNKLGN